LLRTSRPVVPPYVDYRLTAIGTGVAEHIEALVRWIEAHAGDIMCAQREHDAAG
jgi:DNA-binding HxlR family transcriptional regulator